MNFNFVNLKFSICFGLMILTFFGFNKIVVHADSFKVIQNWSFCPFNANSFDSSNCIRYNEEDGYISDFASVNGFTNVTKVFTANFPSGKNGTETHSEFYKYGGTSGCSTGDTISFNLDVILNDVQDLLSNNALNYDFWGSATPTVRSSLTRSSTVVWNNYYSWLGDNTSNIENKIGVSVAKNDHNYNYSQCSFISYGTNKSVRFRCNIASGSTGYQIRLNFYNYSGPFLNALSSSSLPTIVSGIKISMLHDPCLTYSNDQTGVIHAITDQTSDIMQGFQDIIDNNNTNTNSTNSVISDWGNNMASKQDITNSKLNDLQNAILNNNTSSNNGFLSNFNNYSYGNDVQSIFQFPITLLNSIDFSNTTCQPMYFNISGFTRHFWNFDYTFTLPCINIKNIVGNDFYNLLDMFIAFGLFVGFVGHFYLRVHDAISGNNGLASDMAQLASRTDGDGDWVTKRYNKRTGEIK